MQEYYDKVLSAGDTHPLHPDYVTEAKTPTLPVVAPATTTQIPLQSGVALYHQTPTDPNDIAEIYRSHLVKELLTRIGPRSSKDTARSLLQLKKDAKALDIPIAGKKSKQAIAQLIRDTVLKL